MKLITGAKYDTTTLTLTGWTGDADTDGYHVGDYFRDGVYLGPDDDGVEPEFAAPADAQAAD